MLNDCTRLGEFFFFLDKINLQCQQICGSKLTKNLVHGLFPSFPPNISKGGSNMLESRPGTDLGLDKLICLEHEYYGIRLCYLHETQ